MKSIPQFRIIDITEIVEYEKYVPKYLAPMPFRRYSGRQEYLKKAIPREFHKKLLILNGETVGAIEYAPSEASGYPIMGDDRSILL